MSEGYFNYLGTVENLEKEIENSIDCLTGRLVDSKVTRPKKNRIETEIKVLSLMYELGAEKVKSGVNRKEYIQLLKDFAEKKEIDIGKNRIGSELNRYCIELRLKYDGEPLPKKNGNGNHKRFGACLDDTKRGTGSSTNTPSTYGEYSQH
jgi:hypothetical protein